MAVSIKGVDYSHHGFTGAQLAAAGIKFACRYTVNFDSPGADFDKELKRSELVSLSDAGVRVCLNFEWPANPSDSRPLGKEHALANKAALARLGVPDWALTYYSIDSDHQAGTRNNYARGWRDVYPADQLGCYTCGALFRQLKADGFIRLAWQSMSRDFAGNHLPGTTTWDHRGADVIQTGRGTLLGKELDHDTATVTDYGGFLLSDTAPGGDMAVDATDVATILHTDGIIPNPAYRSDSPAHKPPGTNAFVAWQTLAIEAATNSAAALAEVRALKALVGTLPKTGTDPAAVAAAVVAAIGPIADITEDELRDALVAAIIELGDKATP